ncbi:fused MFS/spermidine synthase [Myxococcota bacterium]|nr:fused MFS/spermidine synthase [Myxococcota bacterium]
MRRMVGVLYLFSFLSGAAALIYQVAWAKMLALSFGATTLAVSAVVAGLMGGMGLGAGLYHRAHRRIRAPLRTYAGLEFAIAISAFALTRLLVPLPQWFATLASDVPSGLATDLLRVAASFALLAIPAAFMGATYPALCAALIRSRTGVERHLGAIYGLNTLGAASGALLAGFVTVEQLGLSGSTLLANGINVAVGLGALGLVRQRARHGTPDRPETTDAPLESGLPRALVGAVLVVSGFATLGYEIVWFRGLRYLVGNSTYALTNALVVFLLGLGFGALLYRPVLRRLRPERALGACHLAIGFLALAVIAGEHRILTDPAIKDHLSIFSPVFQIQPWWWRLGATSFAAIALMLPATLLMGLSFPIASRLFVDRVGSIDRRAGGAYLLSNLGSITGSVVAALVLLPLLGTVGATKLLAGLSGLTGAGLLLVAGPRTLRTAAAALGGLALLAGATSLLPSRLPIDGDGIVRLMLPQILYEKEGDLASVQVRSSSENPAHRGMVIDGTVIAASRGWIPTLYEKQVLLAHLPMLLDRTIRRTLNVGLASGSTVAALASYPEVETLDVVEINGPVLEAARYFEESAVLEDPRVTVEIEDAVHSLLRSSTRYDLIISDGKQNEDFSGNARILSREFYAFSAQSLTSCGLFVQWIALSLAPEGFDTVLRTLLDVFPEIEVFYSPPSNVFMVASRCPIEGRPQRTEADLRGLQAERDLLAYGYAGPRDVLSRWIASAAGLRATLPDGPINAADRLVLEYTTYRAELAALRSPAPNLERLLAANTSVPSPAGLALAPAEEPAAQSSQRLFEAYRQSMAGQHEDARRLVRQLLADQPQYEPARQALEQFRRQ